MVNASFHVACFFNSFKFILSVCFCLDCNKWHAFRAPKMVLNFKRRVEGAKDGEKNQHQLCTCIITS